MAALEFKLQHIAAIPVDVGKDMDVYQFNGTYGIDIITDSDGLGFVTIGDPANSGTFKLENIYKNEGTGFTYTQANGGNTLIISKEDDPNRVIINDWSAGDLSIRLTGGAPAVPFLSIVGDYKASNEQACNPHGYWLAGHVFECISRAKLVLFDLNIHCSNTHAIAAKYAIYENIFERRAA